MLDFQLEAANEEPMKRLIAAQRIHAIGPADNGDGLIESGRRKIGIALLQRGAETIAENNFLMWAVDFQAEEVLIAESLQTFDGGEFKFGFAAAFGHRKTSGPVLRLRCPP
jgi:hypothetical protein